MTNPTSQITSERDKYQDALQYAQDISLGDPYFSTICRALRLASRLERPVSHEMLSEASFEFRKIIDGGNKCPSVEFSRTIEWNAMLAQAKREAQDE